MKDNIFECVISKGRGVIAILGGKGDTKVFWNKKNKDEVENARRTFQELVGEKKFAAFSVSKLGRRSKKVTEFDPNIQKLILIPPIAGGAIEYPTGGEAKQSFKIDEEAEIKAMTLLKKEIGEKSFIKFIALGYLEVKGKYGTYRISRDNNIYLYKDDIIGKKKRPLIYNLCVSLPQDKNYLPQGDRLLSFYLLIKNDEDKLIETANFRFVSTTDEFHERDINGRPGDICQQ